MYINMFSVQFLLMQVKIPRTISSCSCINYPSHFSRELLLPLESLASAADRFGVVEPIDKKIEFIPTFARERKEKQAPFPPPEFNFGAFRSVAAIRHRFFCLLFQPGGHS